MLGRNAGVGSVVLLIGPLLLINKSSISERQLVGALLDADAAAWDKLNLGPNLVCGEHDPNTIPILGLYDEIAVALFASPSGGFI